MYVNNLQLILEQISVQLLEHPTLDPLKMSNFLIFSTLNCYYRRCMCIIEPRNCMIVNRANLNYIFHVVSVTELRLVSQKRHVHIF